MTNFRQLDWTHLFTLCYSRMRESGTRRQTCLYKVGVLKVHCWSLVTIKELQLWESRVKEQVDWGIAFLCAVCDKYGGVDTILCTSWGLWTHRSCTPLSPEEFKDYAKSDDYFICRRCTDDEATPGAFSYLRALRRYVQLCVIYTVYFEPTRYAR